MNHGPSHKYASHKQRIPICANISQTYGFYTECVRKYGSSHVWTYFTDMFDFLTLSVVIDDRIFCVHGGLSPSIHSIDQIKIVDRFRGAHSYLHSCVSISKSYSD